MFPAVNGNQPSRAHSARFHAAPLTSSRSVQRVDMFQRLARPPERLTVLPIREFTVGGALTDPRLQVASQRARPAYEALRDPHLAAFWARHSMLPHARDEHKRKVRDAARSVAEKSQFHRVRCEAKTAQDLTELSARRYPEHRSPGDRGGGEDASAMHESPKRKGARNGEQQSPHPPRQPLTGATKPPPSMYAPDRHRGNSHQASRGQTSSTTTTTTSATTTIVSNSGPLSPTLHTSGEVIVLGSECKPSQQQQPASAADDDVGD